MMVNDKAKKISMHACLRASAVTTMRYLLYKHSSFKFVNAVAKPRLQLSPYLLYT